MAQVAKKIANKTEIVFIQVLKGVLKIEACRITSSMILASDI